MNKKIDYEKGFTSIFFMIGLFTFSLFVVSLSLYASSKFLQTAKLQTYSDALTNACACYGVRGSDNNGKISTTRVEMMKKTFLKNAHERGMDFDADLTIGYNLLGTNSQYEEIGCIATMYDSMRNKNIKVSSLCEVIINSQYASYEKSFPENRMLPCMDINKINCDMAASQTIQSVEDIAKQFVNVNGNRYSYNGTVDTYYGHLTAQELFIMDLIDAFGLCGFSDFRTPSKPLLSQSSSPLNGSFWDISDRSCRLNIAQYEGNYVYILESTAKAGMTASSDSGKISIIYCNPYSDQTIQIKEVNYNELSNFLESNDQYYFEISKYANGENAPNIKPFN